MSVVAHFFMSVRGSKFHERLAHFFVDIYSLEDGLEDSLAFYAFPQLDARKISSTNVLERLNREIRRRTGVVGIFPSADAYTRLVTTYLMEYAEDWSSSRAYLSEQSVQALLRPAA